MNEYESKPDGTYEMIEAEKRTRKASPDKLQEAHHESDEKNGNQESEQERSKGVIFHTDKPSSDHSEAA